MRRAAGRRAAEKAQTRRRPEGAWGTTVLVEWPPGHPGTPPHRQSGPRFGYVVEGAVRFELEGEPGGDVMHCRNGNAFSDAPTKFVVTMPCASRQPMLTPGDEEELEKRAHLRAPAAHLRAPRLSCRMLAQAGSGRRPAPRGLQRIHRRHPTPPCRERLAVSEEASSSVPRRFRGTEDAEAQALPWSRQIWFFLVLRTLAGSQVHWWIRARSWVETLETSTHLPLCTATSW